MLEMFNDINNRFRRMSQSRAGNYMKLIYTTILHYVAMPNNVRIIYLLQNSLLPKILNIIIVNYLN